MSSSKSRLVSVTYADQKAWVITPRTCPEKIPSGALCPIIALSDLPRPGAAGVHSVLAGMPYRALANVMPVAHFRFYAELNDFLPPERRFTEFAYGFLDVAPVKDRIESFGVPHTEVDLILVNGQSVDFAYRVQDGDRISVYPVFEAFDIAGLTRLRPE